MFYRGTVTTICELDIVSRWGYFVVRLSLFLVLLDEVNVVHSAGGSGVEILV